MPQRLEELSLAKARAFVAEFDFLLAEMDQESLQDLTKLFEDFARLAIKLWKARTSIRISGMSELADSPFQVGSSKMDGQQAVVSALGQRLNGRPIGVVMRPLITSESVTRDGQPQQPVVWLKALVWVSSQEPISDDAMEDVQ